MCSLLVYAENIRLVVIVDPHETPAKPYKQNSTFRDQFSDLRQANLDRCDKKYGYACGYKPEVRDFGAPWKQLLLLGMLVCTGVDAIRQHIRACLLIH